MIEMYWILIKVCSVTRTLCWWKIWHWRKRWKSSKKRWFGISGVSRKYLMMTPRLDFTLDFPHLLCSCGSSGMLISFTFLFDVFGMQYNLHVYIWKYIKLHFKLFTFIVFYVQRQRGWSIGLDQTPTSLLIASEHQQDPWT